MTDLRELQCRVQQFLLDPFLPEHLQPIAALIRPAGRAAVAVRTGVYAEAYRARLLEALRTDYSALHAWLGDEAFEQLALAYIEQYPSHYFSLRHFGGYLAEFAAESVAYKNDIEIAEMARFEWAQCDAFDAADAKPLSIESLVALDPQAWLSLQLRFHPSMQRLALRSNVPELWAPLNANAEPPALIIANEATAWLIWRQDLRLLYRALAPLEACALDRFAQGGNFADVCEALLPLAAEEEIPALVAGLLRRWIEAGLIVAFAT